MRAREIGVAAGVIIVEVDEEGRDPLSAAQLLGVAGIAGVEIVVRLELLTDCIVEHLAWFEQRERKPGRDTDPQPDRFDDRSMSATWNSMARLVRAVSMVSDPESVTTTAGCRRSRARWISHAHSAGLASPRMIRTRGASQRDSLSETRLRFSMEI